MEGLNQVIEYIVRDIQNALGDLVCAIKDFGDDCYADGYDKGTEDSELDAEPAREKLAKEVMDGQSGS